MKIKLILARTESDNMAVAWAAIKTIMVEIPLDKQDGWNVIGAEWEGDKDEEMS
jgi:hypothetical protein